MSSDDLWLTFQANLRRMPSHTVQGLELFAKWRTHIAGHPRAGFGDLPLTPGEFYRQLQQRGYQRDPAPGPVWFLDVRFRGEPS